MIQGTFPPSPFHSPFYSYNATSSSLCARSLPLLYLFSTQIIPPRSSLSNQPANWVKWKIVSSMLSTVLTDTPPLWQYSCASCLSTFSVCGGYMSSLRVWVFQKHEGVVSFTIYFLSKWQDTITTFTFSSFMSKYMDSSGLRSFTFIYICIPFRSLFSRATFRSVALSRRGLNTWLISLYKLLTTFTFFPPEIFLYLFFSYPEYNNSMITRLGE